MGNQDIRGIGLASMGVQTVTPRCQELNFNAGVAYPCTACAAFVVVIKRVYAERYRCARHMRWNQAEGVLVSATPL